MFLSKTNVKGKSVGGGFLVCKRKTANTFSWPSFGPNSGRNGNVLRCDEEVHLFNGEVRFFNDVQKDSNNFFLAKFGPNSDRNGNALRCDEEVHRFNGDVHSFNRTNAWGCFRMETLSKDGFSFERKAVMEATSPS